jgi:hypothetical protein
MMGSSCPACVSCPPPKPVNDQPTIAPISAPTNEETDADFEYELVAIDRLVFQNNADPTTRVFFLVPLRCYR